MSVRLFVFVALCVGVLVAPAARAGIIQYTFSPDATMTIAGDTFSISGTFDFNTTTSAISAPNVTFTLGGATETFSSLDSSHGPACANSTDMICLDAASGDFFGAAFSNSFALGATDPLALLGTGSEKSGCGCSDLAGVSNNASAVTGNVVPGSVVPEPATIAILSIGLGALGFMRRKRARLSHQVVDFPLMDRT